MLGSSGRGLELVRESLGGSEAGRTCSQERCQRGEFRHGTRVGPRFQLGRRERARKGYRTPRDGFGGFRLTPLVVMGLEGLTALLNSPWAGVMEAGFLLADITAAFAAVESFRLINVLYLDYWGLSKVRHQLI